MNFNLLLAAHWIRDPEYVEVLLKSMAVDTEHQANYEFVNIIACNADPKLAQATLRQIAAQEEKYSERVRETAAMQLRLMYADRKLDARDRKLLYGGDVKAAVAAISTRLLNEKEIEARQSLFEMLKEAPDEVLCGLSETAAKLPEATEDQTLKELIKGAEMRMKAVAQFPVPNEPGK